MRHALPIAVTAVVLAMWAGGSEPASRAQPAPSAAAPAACGSCHAVPPTSGAHLRHIQSSLTTSVECSSCHFADDFARIHQNGRVDVVFAVESGSEAKWAEGRCANVYCHGNGRGRTREVAWTDEAATCASCHDDETSPEIRLSGRHAHHLRIGVGCADCHGAVVTRQKAIADPSLHINGKVDVKVLAGRYAGGSCQPACHDSRSW